MDRLRTVNTTDVRYSLYDEIVSRYRLEEGNIISLLQDTQDVFGYIPEDAIFYFSTELKIPSSEIYGVATFYAQFYLKPRGKNRIIACCGTACHVKGADRLISAIKRGLGLNESETTTADMKFSIDEVSCVGACSIAPVVIINDKVYGKSTLERVSKEIKALTNTP